MRRIWNILWDNGLRRILEPVGKVVQAIINYVLLLIVFIIGIGVTSLIGKISGVSFLDVSPKSSYWKTHQRQGDHYRMH